MTESNLRVGTGETICFGENIASLKDFYTVSKPNPHPQFVPNKFTSFTNSIGPNQIM